MTVCLRVYPARASAPAGYELVALVETTPALGRKAKIKEMEVVTKDGTCKLDNKEDMEIEPGETVGTVFLSRSTHRLLGEIQQIRLPLNNVARWVRVPAGQAPDVAQ
ncbi:MAG: hypothetical protein K6U09_01130 [Acidobacteriia bacterium]|jgi:hypothetical protein|nr:hypothetical protein [Terriglobia bacterium]